MTAEAKTARRASSALVLVSFLSVGAWLAAGLSARAAVSYPVDEIVLDYIFSIALLLIAAVLLRQSEPLWATRLLSAGLVGAAGAYNLQARSANEQYAAFGAVFLHGAGTAACVAGLMLLAVGAPTRRSRVVVTAACASAGLLSAGLAAYAPPLGFLVSLGLVTPLLVLSVRPVGRTVGAADPGTRRRARAVWSVSVALLATTTLVVGTARLTQGMNTPGLLGQVGGVSVSGPQTWRYPEILAWLGPQVSAFWVYRFVAVAAFGALAWGLARSSTRDFVRLVDRTLVYSVLLALVGGVYVLGVVRVDASFGLNSDWLAPPQVAAAALAALAFQPVRAGLERLVDRAVYGRRLTAYEAMARVSALAWAGSGGAEALRSLAELTARTLGAEHAAVHLATPGGGELTYRWPNYPQARSAEQRIPVTYQGNFVGTLAVPATRGSMPRRQQALMDDLSRSAGVVLRNTAITFDLAHRLSAAEAHSAAMRASRWRIVAAQDSERRDLERDLHDVAQPALTSVRLTLGLLNHLVTSRNDDAYDITLDQLQTQIGIAAGALRQTLRSIDPPALTQAGIVPALEETAESLRVDVSFRIGASADGVRFARPVEAAVYYCCAEALQNCAKHSPGAEVELALDLRGDGQLSFQVSDSGPGFDMASISPGSGLQNMADRLAVAGGELAIDSRPGGGTRVRGIVPTRSTTALP